MNPKKKDEPQKWASKYKMNLNNGPQNKKNEPQTDCYLTRPTFKIFVKTASLMRIYNIGLDIPLLF